MELLQSQDLQPLYDVPDRDNEANALDSSLETTFGSAESSPQGQSLPELLNQLYDGKTALHMASESGRPDVVRLLLQYGADPATRYAWRGYGVRQKPCSWRVCCKVLFPYFVYTLLPENSSCHLRTHKHSEIHRAAHHISCPKIGQSETHSVGSWGTSPRPTTTLQPRYPVPSQRLWRGGERRRWPRGRRL